MSSLDSANYDIFSVYDLHEVAAQLGLDLNILTYRPEDLDVHEYMKIQIAHDINTIFKSQIDLKSLVQNPDFDGIDPNTIHIELLYKIITEGSYFDKYFHHFTGVLQKGRISAWKKKVDRFNSCKGDEFINYELARNPVVVASYLQQEALDFEQFKDAQALKENMLMRVSGSITVLQYFARKGELNFSFETSNGPIHLTIPQLELNESFPSTSFSLLQLALLAHYSSKKVKVLKVDVPVGITRDINDSIINIIRGDVLIILPGKARAAERLLQTVVEF